MEISQASNLPAQVHLINSKFLIKQNAPRKKLFWNKFHFITWVKSSLFHPRMAKLIFGFNRSRLGTLLFILLLLLILQLNVQKFQISTKLPAVILFLLAKRSGNFGNSTSRKSPRRIFFYVFSFQNLFTKFMYMASTASWAFRARSTVLFHLALELEIYARILYFNYYTMEAHINV